MTGNDDDKADYNAEHTVGKNNMKLLNMELHGPVFLVSVVIAIAFVIGALIVPMEANQLLRTVQNFAIDTFHWLFMMTGNLLVIFCLLLMVLPASRIRLGGRGSKPEFSRMSWLAMLYATGMGIGLMFWGVAEPVAHYTGWVGTPLNVMPRTDEAADLAMGATIFHWGLHAWAFYVIVGLALAYFSFNRGLPFVIRSVMYPLLHERIWGWPGHLIDTVAVLSTVLGISTSLGFGVQQAAGGIAYLYGFDNSLALQLVIVTVVTAVTMVSVVLGLVRGVRVLSNVNMLLAMSLMLFVFLSGPTATIAKGLFNNTVQYLADIVPLSNWIGREDQSWYKGWTVFYWAWWISWSPFVGMFIARISRGRTIREFIAAALLVPTVVSVLWMSVFGGTALDQARSGIGEFSTGITDVSILLFQMLEHLPLASLVSAVGVILVLIFFITSADSASIVLAYISTGGQIKTRVTLRVFWVLASAAIASTLLIAGANEGISALQAAAISAGLPFCVILLAMCASLYVGLHEDIVRLDTASQSVR